MNSQPTAKHLQDYLSPDFYIDTLDLIFELDESATHVTASSRVRRNGVHSKPLNLDGEQVTLLEVSIDGEATTAYIEEPGKLILSDVPDEFELKIVTEIDPAGNSALQGLYKSGDGFCTQCEAEGFRHITYYLDRPDVLARFSTRIIADKAAYPYLLSNGNKVGQGETEDGRHWVQWQDPHLKPAYLFALVAGDFDLLEDKFTTQSGREVALELFVDKGNLDRAPHAMASLINAMKWDEDRFGLEYDLDIYMIVAVDFFNMGAMENKGLNVFNSKYVLANEKTATDQDYLDIEAVIGHEYFHNWTGNRITCRDWFQLSLKEGLTVFRDQEFSCDLGSRAVNRIKNVKIIRSHQFAEDAGPMSHPIRPESVIEMNNFYTVTVYNKGSEVIRMIHTLLGEQGFQAGMTCYVERHDGQAVTCDDFVQAMEDGSGVDLRLFRRWYQQSGTPVVSVTDSFNPDTNEYTLTLSQQTPVTAEQKEKQPLHIPVDLELLDDKGNPLAMDGQLSQVLNFTQAEQTFTFTKIPHKPTPSLFREFSAPVKYHFDYQDEQLALLLRSSSNEFARWDASQNLFNKYLLSNVDNIEAGKEPVMPELVVDAFRGLLLDKSLDPALIAETLEFPSESALWELFDEVNVEAVHQARESMVLSLAGALQDELLCLYHVHHGLNETSMTADAMASRKLKNTCLKLLALADKEQTIHLTQSQYSKSQCMTDTLGALIAANHGQLESRETMMADFSEVWHHDGLVMDKWFTLQASNPAPDCLEQVVALQQHKSFDIKNPNRTRALIGAFAVASPYHFHAADGSGYQFLTDKLIELNKINPQVAARLITPLIQFKRLDSGRQVLIKGELKRLLSLDNLAKDLFEKVTKALEQ